MNKYQQELCEEIEQDNGIQYDEEIRQEMFDYIFFENNKE